MALSRWRRANPVLTLAVLQAFFSELPDVRQAYAQEAKGIHCAVGTGSCGNWLELGGYKTSCKIFRDATLMRAALMSLTPCLPKSLQDLCVADHDLSVLCQPAGAECGGEPAFIEQPVPGAPDPRVKPHSRSPVASILAHHVTVDS